MKRCILSCGKCGWIIGISVLLPLVARGVPTGAERTAMAWDRYQVILEREPFGRAPKPGDPGTEVDAGPVVDEPVVPEGPTLAETVRLSVVTRYGGTPAAGFTDTTTGRSFYLFEGQSVEEFTLVSVEASSGAATLRKGAQEERLVLGGMGAAAGPVASAPAGGAGVRQSSDTLSYAARQRQRAEEARARAEEARRKAEEARQNQQEQVERLTGEALQKHLRDLNMEMIRSGSGPPLPIELTEDEVSQLAAEGFEIPASEGAAPGEPVDRRLIRRLPRLPANEPVAE